MVGNQEGTLGFKERQVAQASPPVLQAPAPAVMQAWPKHAPQGPMQALPCQRARHLGHSQPRHCQLQSRSRHE
eukprot:14708124-Alexandrium_andersonii.AAC.1